MAVITQILANGQLAASAGSIYATAPDEGIRVAATLTNVGGNPETVILTITPNGGTARRLARVLLSANEMALVSGIPLNSSDTLKGETTNATSVDYMIHEVSKDAPLNFQFFDANGALKSGSAADSGARTINGDLTLQNSGGFSGIFWDASDVADLWANCPVGLHSDPGLAHIFFDDFTNPASATASDYHAYTSTDDGGTGTNAFQDAANGVYNIVTAAADNDYHAMSSVAENWLFVAGKKLWFEARFRLSEATTNESTWWFGLTDTLTTGGMQANTSGPLASYDGALIWKTPETALTVNFETSNAGTQNTLSAFGTSVSNTWSRAGFYFDGTATTSTIKPYFHNGTSWETGAAQNITLSGLEEMHLVFGVKAGPTAAAETLQVDYVKCVQLR